SVCVSRHQPTGPNSEAALEKGFVFQGNGGVCAAYGTGVEDHHAIGWRALRHYESVRAVQSLNAPLFRRSELFGNRPATWETEISTEFLALRAPALFHRAAANLPSGCPKMLPRFGKRF